MPLSAATIATTEALQVIGVAMGMPVRAGVARAAAFCASNLIDQPDNLIQLGCRVQGIEHLRALPSIQQTELG
jgi:hypothetical protein